MADLTAFDMDLDSDVDGVYFLGLDAPMRRALRSDQHKGEQHCGARGGSLTHGECDDYH